jgi:hypothetical protein
MKKNVSYLLIAILLFCALFFRFYRLKETTIFLSDQGVEGLEIYNSYIQKTFPLVGPSSSYGFYQGPAFYYLIYIPFVLSNFNPLFVIYYLALFGVATTYLIYRFGTKLFNEKIAFAIAFLYAVSPSMSTSDKTLWNPTTIPFFSLVLLFSYFQIVHSKRSLLWWIIQGACLSILVQLHHTNYFLILLTFLFSVYLCIYNRAKIYQYMKGIIISIIAFLLVMSPFIYYEINNNFIDMSNFILIFFFPSYAHSMGISNQYFVRVASSISKLYSLFIPFSSLLSAVGIFALILTILKQRKYLYWPLLFAFWIIMGSFTIGLISTDYPNHYLYFMIIPGIISFGYLLTLFEKSFLKQIVTVLWIVLLLWQMKNSDVFSKGTNDIPRIENIVSEIYAVAKDKPFIFGLLSTRYFSDTHYRFFFKVHHLTALDISSNANLLFLVCDNIPCPNKNTLINKPDVDIQCNTYDCGIIQTKIDLRNWKYSKKIEDEKSTLYIFVR